MKNANQRSRNCPNSCHLFCDQLAEVPAKAISLLVFSHSQKPQTTLSRNGCMAKTCGSMEYMAPSLHWRYGCIWYRRLVLKYTHLLELWHRSGTGNWLPSRCCWSTVSIIPNHWPWWLGLMGAGAPQNLGGNKVLISDAGVRTCSWLQMIITTTPSFLIPHPSSHMIPYPEVITG